MQSPSEKSPDDESSAARAEPDEPSLLVIDSGDEHSPISLKNVLEELSPPRSRRPSMHDLQKELDTVLRDVTNIVDSCLVSPCMPKKPLVRPRKIIQSSLM
jgi:hypothetical protein